MAWGTAILQKRSGEDDEERDEAEGGEVRQDYYPPETQFLFVQNSAV